MEEEEEKKKRAEGGAEGEGEDEEDGAALLHRQMARMGMAAPPLAAAEGRGEAVLQAERSESVLVSGMQLLLLMMMVLLLLLHPLR